MSEELRAQVEALIPYKTVRKGQLELALEVAKAYAEKAILLARYPTGIGKTAAVLAGALASGAPKVVYLARSKSQFQAPLREVKRLLERGISVPTVVLVNKKNYCLLRGALPLDYEEFLHFCRVKRFTGACPYSSEFEDAEIPVLVTPKSARSLGAKLGVCPFELAWKALRKARLVVASYPYVFREDLRRLLVESLGTPMDVLMLVVDEAHNLPDHIAESTAIAVSDATLRRAISELRAAGIGQELASSLSNLLGYMKRIKGAEEGVRIPLDELTYLVPPADEVKRVALALEKLTGMYSSLWQLYAFAEALRRASHEYLVTAVSSDGSVSLKLVLINPGKVSREVFPKVRSAVLMSSTLMPAEYYVAVLGFPGERVREVSYPFVWSENVDVVIVKGISSRYVERGEELYRRYASAIDYIFELPSTRRALAIFPSYSFMMGVYPYIRSKPVIIERRDSTIGSMLGKVLELEKALLLVVARGKFAEGVEFTVLGKSLIDTIVIAGLPVPEPSVENEKLYELLQERLGDRDLAWKYVYLYPAFMQVVQGIGRGVRSEKDKVKVFILDERMIGEGEKYLSMYGLVPRVGKLPL
ncbi:ATP-dependent DNA helicase [Thermofilum pendens]|uniref:DEAD_2 domain protein n=1 Tax=Thermofilum pendens (strain DSM 2475 / Hrk 5) TaxID=368408 RepID=A1RXF7_THEPD|nr:ATP-dependent DNA helicase [Thermofilum pendens]ABL77887.1 DEAD_2 domain protein [Thermofilum pendens Hrk 5]